MTKPCIAIDLRDDEFKTVDEMCALLTKYHEEANGVYGSVTPVLIVMHADQQKWLRLERVEKGELNPTDAKTMMLASISDIPVQIVNHYDSVVGRCPGCGREE